MPWKFNAAQLAILDRAWSYKGDDEERPPKRRSIALALQCWDVGPPVTSQAVGRYFSERAAAENGRPRATQKTPEQLSILKASWASEPYPTTGALILLVHETGLKHTQVKAWFETQRKKADDNGDMLYMPNRMSTQTASAKMWRAYKKEPDTYAEKLKNGHISKVTGEEIDGLEDEESFVDEDGVSDGGRLKIWRANHKYHAPCEA